MYIYQDPYGTLTPPSPTHHLSQVSFEEAKALICKSLSCAADLTKAPGPTRDAARPRCVFSGGSGGVRNGWLEKTLGNFGKMLGN